MALHQISFFILPKESFRSVSKSDKFEFGDEYLFDDSAFWLAKNISPTFFEPISKILLRGKSWSENILLFGNENSNRVEVFFEKDIVKSVTFRIDFISEYEIILNKLIEFFILNELTILNSDLEILPLNFEVIKSFIEDSVQIVTYRRLSKGK